MTAQAPVSAKEPPGLSLVNQMTLERRRLLARLKGLPPRIHKAIELRAKVAILTHELLACEPPVRAMLAAKAGK